LTSLKIPDTLIYWTLSGDITIYRSKKEIKAVFLTNKRLFEPKVIYFGLCNSLGTFIMEALTKWRQYLLDTMEKFEV